MRITRRKLLLSAAATTAGAALTGLYTWRVEPHWPRIISLPMPIPGLPPALHGTRLAQISDLHVGPRVDSDYLIASLHWINDDIRPDLIALTGDFMHCHGQEVIPELTRVISHLRIPRLGAFSILGNHDYGRAWRDLSTGEACAAALASLGHTILRNQSFDLQGLTLLGLDDLWTSNFTPEKFPASPPGPSLLLVHNPDAVDHHATPHAHWTLSGHTHGGQCRFPGFTPPMLPIQNKRYAAGQVALTPSPTHPTRTLYVNRGLGYLRRVRFAVRPEVTLFTLLPA